MSNSVNINPRNAKRKSIDIDKQILIDKHNMRTESKLLLFGQPGSGKKTIIKNMNLENHFCYTESEKRDYKDTIITNIVKFMRIIIKEMENHGKSFHNRQNKENSDLIMSLPNPLEETIFPTNVADAIKELWKDKNVQKSYHKCCNAGKLDKTVKEDFENIDKIIHPDYIPTEEDILNCCIKNSDSVSEILFHCDTWKYRIINVNGLKSDHRKWISCFEDIKAIIIVCDISAYDEPSDKDEEMTHLQYDMDFFSWINKSKWFEKTTVILFLNKTDLFKEKLNKVPLNQFFPWYTYGNDYSQALTFIMERFIQLNEKRKLYIKPNCDTDYDQFDFLTAVLHNKIPPTTSGD